MLEAEGIRLEAATARLQIGTQDAPFSHQATLRIGGGGIIAAAGSVELHGRPQIPTWTRLAASAARRDSSLLLSQPVNWQVRLPNTWSLS